MKDQTPPAFTPPGEWDFHSCLRFSSFPRARPAWQPCRMVTVDQGADQGGKITPGSRAGWKWPAPQEMLIVLE